MVLTTQAAACADEVVTISSAAVNAVIEVAGSAGDAHLGQSTPTGTKAQQWIRTSGSRLRNVHTGHCMSGSGNYVLLRDCTSSDPSQRWRFLPAGDHVMLTSEATAEGAVLRGSEAVPNSLYGLFEPDGSPIFRWKVERCARC